MNWIKNVLNSDHRLGFRIVKSGIAVTLCVCFSQLFKLNQPFSAVIATVLTMEKSVDTSFRTGAQKLAGALIGALIGGSLGAIAPGNAGLCGVGIILTLYLCHFFKLKEGSLLGCFLFASLILNMSGHIPVRFTVNSLLDTWIGILIGILVNVVIMPPNYAAEVKKYYGALSHTMGQLLLAVQEGGELNYREAQDLVRELDNSLRMYVSLMKFMRSDDKEVFRIVCKTAVYREMINELIALETLGREKKEELGSVYDYHLKRLRELHQSLSE